MNLGCWLATCPAGKIWPPWFPAFHVWPALALAFQFWPAPAAAGFQFGFGLPPHMVLQLS